MNADNFIFDLDDTLYDQKSFRKRFRRTIDGLLRENGVSISLFWSRYDDMCIALERDLINGVIDGYAYQVKRFNDPLSGLTENHLIIAEDMRNAYFSELSEIQLFVGVPTLFRALQLTGKRIFLLTNGTAMGQKYKVDVLGISEQIEKIYYCEEIGYFKPDKRAFEYILNDAQLDPGRTVMIGDSLTNDVYSSRQCGILPILIDPHNMCADPSVITVTAVDSVMTLISE